MPHCYSLGSNVTGLYVAPSLKRARMSGSKVTISDIAATAGVSKATVSRYINGRMDLISAPTRARIKKAIAASGYHPSAAAQQLSRGASSEQQARPEFTGVVVRDFSEADTGRQLQSYLEEKRAEGQKVLACHINAGESVHDALEFLYGCGAAAVVYIGPDTECPKRMEQD